MPDMKKKAMEVSDMLNSMGFSPEEFCKEMTKDHRTIQQNFTRLCIEWIKTCAREDYRFDGRNEASHKVCKTICDKMSEEPYWDSIPFI